MNHLLDAHSKENRLTCHPVGRPLSGSASQTPKPSQGPMPPSGITIFFYGEFRTNLDAGLRTIKKIKNKVQQVQYVQQVQPCGLGCPDVLRTCRGPLGRSRPVFDSEVTQTRGELVEGQVGLPDNHPVSPPPSTPTHHKNHSLSLAALAD